MQYISVDKEFFIKEYLKELEELNKDDGDWLSLTDTEKRNLVAGIYDLTLKEIKNTLDND